MKNRTLSILQIPCLVLAATLTANAQTPPDLTSAFATSAENWRAGTNTATLTWQATGGAPDGHLRGTGPAGTNAWHFISPES